MNLLVHRIDPQLPLPSYAHPGDAGLDLYTRVDAVLPPGERALLPTGIAIALPAGYAAFVHPRSGLAVKQGIGVVNGPGTIDAGYRGEVQVCLINLDPRRDVRFTRGDRIAQLVVQEVPQVGIVEVEALPGSARDTGGFGSTGGHRDVP